MLSLSSKKFFKKKREVLILILNSNSLKNFFYLFLFIGRPRGFVRPFLRFFVDVKFSLLSGVKVLVPDIQQGLEVDPLCGGGRGVGGWGETSTVLSVKLLKVGVNFLLQKIETRNLLKIFEIKDL